jgi:hypothetical protein
MSSESRDASAASAASASPSTAAAASIKSKKLKLVHVVSLVGVLLLVTGFYESWQSQKSMQALFFTNLSLGKIVGEYAVVDGMTSSSSSSSTTSSSDSSETTASATATATATDTATDTAKQKTQKSVSSHNSQLHQIQTKNRTAQIPKQLFPQHVQRTAETTTTNEQSEQQQQEQPNTSNNDQNDKNSNKKPLNIVLLYADDWTMKTLGVLNKHVKTPALDALAAQGMVFTNNCVTTSICWISRASMVTGQTAGQHGHLKIAQQVLFRDNKWNSTLFPTLKRNGYWTGFVGKWHAPLPPQHAKYTFDYQNLYYGSHWEKRDGVRRHVTDLNRQDAISFLQKRPDKTQPFALTVSFFATHAVDGQHYPNQYQPMPESAEWYPNATTHIPNPKTNTQQHWDDLPWFFDERNEGRGRWKNRYDTPDRYQVSMKNYYRMASEVDHACGEIIKELKAQGVYDNTLIIFTTDNGVSTATIARSAVPIPRSTTEISLFFTLSLSFFPTIQCSAIIIIIITNTELSR